MLLVPDFALGQLLRTWGPISKVRGVTVMLMASVNTPYQRSIKIVS